MRTLHIGIRVGDPRSRCGTDPDGYRIEPVQWPPVIPTP